MTKTCTGLIYKRKGSTKQVKRNVPIHVNHSQILSNIRKSPFLTCASGLIKRYNSVGLND